MGDRVGGVARGDDESLREGDEFLRRAAYPKHVMDNTVYWKVFHCRGSDNSLSFTLRTNELLTQDGIDRYQSCQELPSGDLPAVVMVSYSNLTKDVPPPPLAPRREDDPSDLGYGHLHCVTPCPSRQQAKDLANIATQTGNILAPFVPGPEL